MHSRAAECPKCAGAMEPGFLLDKAHHGMPSNPEWVEEKPERCGFLESYASSA